MKFRVLSTFTLSALMCVAYSGCEKKGSDKKDDPKESGTGKSKDNDTDNSDNTEDETKTGKKDDKTDKKKDDTSGSDSGGIPKKYKGEKNPNKTSDKKIVEAGKSLYSKNCSSCHGADGTGKVKGTPDFTTSKAAEWADDLLLWKISEGTDDGMPGYKDKLKTDEIWEVVTYMRTLSEK